MLADGTLKLNSAAYVPVDPKNKSGVGRYLVYQHSNPPFSIWAFAFSEGQKTSIHDHKFKGTVTVLEGPISEKKYTPTSDKTAEIVSQADRHQFHAARDDLEDKNLTVHQLKLRKNLREPGAVSVTLHIYDMPAKQILQSEGGLEVDNRNLLHIFSKSKPSTNKQKPPYEQQHRNSANK